MGGAGRVAAKVAARRVFIGAFALACLALAGVACGGADGDAIGDGALEDARDDGRADGRDDAAAGDAEGSHDGDADSADDAADDADGAPFERLDCAWVRGDANCWRALVRDVDACLGAAGSASGTFAPDFATCRYDAGARVVTFTPPIDPTDVAEHADRALTIDAHGARCLRYDERRDVDGLVAEGPRGALVYVASHDVLRVTCPDGRRLEGSASALVAGCGADLLDGGLPARQFAALSGTVRFRLIMQRDWAFVCASP